GEHAEPRGDCEACVAADVCAGRSAPDHFDPGRYGSGRAVQPLGPPAGRTEESRGRRAARHDCGWQARRIYASGEPASIRRDQSVPGKTWFDGDTQIGFPKSVNATVSSTGANASRA